jgi:Gamma-glutamyl phosphate reductase
VGYSEFLNCNNLDKQMKINKSKIPAEIKKQLENARKSSFVLSNLNVTKKNQILYDLSFKLRASLSEILEENFKDIINAKKLYELGELSLSLFERVKLTESKIEQMAVYCESVAKLTNPNGKIIDATRLDIGLELYKVTCPIGVILMIFESRPDAVIQISSLGLKSGNAIILKGGKEASFSNRILVKLIRETINKISDSSVNSISLVETRVEVNELIKLSQDLDLIIPRGSNQMVQKIQSKSMVPVLGHADGICHVFLDNEER